MITVDNPWLRLLKFILLAFFFLIDIQIFPVEVFAGKPVEESNFIEVLARVTHSTAINPELISCFANKATDFLPLAKTSIVTLIDFSLPGTARRLSDNAHIEFHANDEHKKDHANLTEKFKVPQRFNGKKKLCKFREKHPQQ